MDHEWKFYEGIGEFCLNCGSLKAMALDCEKRQAQLVAARLAGTYNYEVDWRRELKRHQMINRFFDDYREWYPDIKLTDMLVAIQEAQNDRTKIRKTPKR